MTAKTWMKAQMVRPRGGCLPARWGGRGTVARWGCQGGGGGGVEGTDPVQCGWEANHTLEGAQDVAKEFLSKRDEWSVIFINE